MACKEESLNFAEHGGAHTTSVLDTECHASQWHIAKLSHNYAKKRWLIQANTWTLCNAKVEASKHAPLL